MLTDEQASFLKRYLGFDPGASVPGFDTADRSGDGQSGGSGSDGVSTAPRPISEPARGPAPRPNGADPGSTTQGAVPEPRPAPEARAGDPGSASGADGAPQASSVDPSTPASGDPSTAASGDPSTPQVAAQVPVSDAENKRLDALSPEELIREDLTQVDVETLFTEEYMESLIDVEIKGEGDPKLPEIMRKIQAGLSDAELPEVMDALARIVGTPPTADELGVDHGRYVQLLRQQEANEAANGKEDVPQLDEGMHPDFMGSRGQLLFGKVIGDAFGIHEVFASLLSSTGGLVGPGNYFIEPGQVPGVDFVKAGHLSPDNPVALHGTVHDAAGYLLNYHNDGPGYNYLDSDLELFETDDPYAGQLSGVIHWVMEAGDDYLINRADEAVAAVEEQLAGIRDDLTDLIDDMLDQYDETKQSAEDFAKDVGEAVDEMKDKALEVVEDMGEEVDELKEDAMEAIDAVGEGVDRLKDEALGLVDDAGEEAERLKKEALDLVEAAGREADKLKDDALDLVNAAGDEVDELKEDALELLDAAGEGADDIKKDLLDVIEAAGDAIDDMKDDALEVVDAAGGGIEDMKEDALEVVEAVESEIEDAKKDALEVVEAVEKQAGKIAQDMRDVVSAVEDEVADMAEDIGEVVSAVEETAGEAGDAVLEVAGAVGDGLEKAADAAVEVFDAITGSDSGSFTEMAAGKIGALSSFIWG